MRTERVGSLLIAAAALLWATDAVFRLPSVALLDPVFLVGAEHLVGLLVLLPYVILTQFGSLTGHSSLQWMGLGFVGLGGSALATVFFTASFRYINPSVAILLQKLQPLFVVILAMIFLRERPGRRFFLWAGLAFVAAAILSVPDIRLGMLEQGMNFRSRGNAYALSAAGLWACSTVIARGLLASVPPTVATFWRYAFGFTGLLAFWVIGSAHYPASTLADPRVLHSIGYMALVPGLLALLLYYQGLLRTEASTATIIELLFPVSAVVINTYYLGLPLNPVQAVAGAVLVLAVTLSVRSSA